MMAAEWDFQTLANDMDMKYIKILITPMVVDEGLKEHFDTSTWASCRTSP